MKTKFWTINFIFLLELFILSSCSPVNDRIDILSADNIQVVIEDNEHLNLTTSIYQAEYGQDLILDLNTIPGFKITGCDYQDYVLEPTASGYSLTLNDLKYSTVITIYTSKSDLQINYYLNCPSISSNLNDSFCEYREQSHISTNTCRYNDIFDAEGYTLFAWNTSKDGAGTDIPLGSRFNASSNKENNLYGHWAKWTDAALFTYTDNTDGLTITGYCGTDDELIIPAVYNGKKITRIASDSFIDVTATRIILSPTIKDIESDAFTDCLVKELVLFDNIEHINDYSFNNCINLKTLIINAASDPVYSGSYYATFPDKIDYLKTLQNDQSNCDKLVLFSGSSTRFGYDSELIEQKIPQYKVANMGVFAYTNALPQLDMILQFMDEGDILLDSPEFDASRRQFCVLNKLDDKFFNMIEENYSLISLLDISKYSSVFSAFEQYLTNRRGMQYRSYDLSPSDFDENYVPVSTKSYNSQGDYCLYRPNALDDSPVFDLPVDYQISAFPEEYLTALNNEAKKFTDKDILFLFTYAPRNEKALSKESTKKAREELDIYLRNGLDFPVISDIEGSLYPGKYLFETDNHLSTEGVSIRTEQIINDLIKQLDIKGEQ